MGRNIRNAKINFLYYKCTEMQLLPESLTLQQVGPNAQIIATLYKDNYEPSSYINQYSFGIMKKSYTSSNTMAHQICKSNT